MTQPFAVVVVPSSQDNVLDAETNNRSVRDPELATAPLNIHPGVKVRERREREHIWT